MPQRQFIENIINMAIRDTRWTISQNLKHESIINKIFYP